MHGYFIHDADGSFFDSDLVKYLPLSQLASRTLCLKNKKLVKFSQLHLLGGIFFFLFQ